MTTERTCKFCKQTKDESLFVKDSTVKSGYRNKCRECHNNKNAKWVEENYQTYLESCRKAKKKYQNKNK